MSFARQRFRVSQGLRVIRDTSDGCLNGSAQYFAPSGLSSRLTSVEVILMMEDTDRIVRKDRMLTVLLRDRNSAEQAYSSLTGRGYGKDDINLVMSDATRKKYFSDKPAREPALRATD